MTPARSMEPSLAPEALPAALEANTTAPRKRMRSASERRNTADRKMIWLHVTKALEDKPGLMLKDAKALTRVKMEEKLKEKEKKDGVTTRMLYPHHWKVAVEEDRLDEKITEWYSTKERATRVVQDRDDEEAPPPSRVKVEEAREQGVSKTTSRSSKMHEQQVSDQEDDADEPEKPTIAVVCSRSYAIRHGCAGLRILERRAEEARARAANPDNPEVRVEVVLSLIHI